MTTLKDLGKYWIESWGRNRAVSRYTFPDNEIVAPGVRLNVSEELNATYLNLHPSHYAVAIASDGKILNLKGGYNQLASGEYILHFVDRQYRVSNLPDISGTTLDGSQVSIELFILYRVADPIKALEIKQPVDTLFAFIRSDLMEFIRSRTHAEIVGGNHGNLIESMLIRNYIRKQQDRRQQMSKLFFIADTVIQELQVNRDSVRWAAFR